ncbi:hypothetical protein BH11ACT2_BH11ACT2_21890 [soil metagenome]
MAHNEEELSHGHSPASWTAVVIMLAAFAAGTIFFWFDVPAGVWASVGLLIVGAIVGKVMQKLGYGVDGPRTIKAHE